MSSSKSTGCNPLTYSKDSYPVPNTSRNQANPQAYALESNMYSYNTQENQHSLKPVMYTPYILVFLPNNNFFNPNSPQNLIGNPYPYPPPNFYYTRKFGQQFCPLTTSYPMTYNNACIFEQIPTQVQSRQILYPDNLNQNSADNISIPDSLESVTNQDYYYETISTANSNTNFTSYNGYCTLSSIPEKVDLSNKTDLTIHSSQVLNSKVLSDSLNSDSSDAVESLSTSASSNFVKHSNSHGLSTLSKNYTTSRHNCNISPWHSSSDFSLYNTQEKHHQSVNFQNVKKLSQIDSTHDDIYENGGNSFGTHFHVKGTCNPCRFEWTRGCHVGINCRFCHHESHAPEGCSRVKPSENALNKNFQIRENILNNLSKSAKEWRAQRNLPN